MREAYAAAQLVHHNITQIYDIGADKGLNFFSMEFIDGKTLGQMMRDSGGLDPHESVAFIIQAAHGLKYAHDNGMIHRDIKPDNLLVNDQNVVKVNDLGLVKTPESQDDQIVDDDGDLTKQHVRRAMGTPAYMSPEQARNPAIADERSDVYSLGCTLYRMITARPLFAGSTPLEVMNQHVNETVESSSLIDHGIPQWLVNVLMKMIAKDPDHRQQTMTQVIEDLQQTVSTQSGPAIIDNHAAPAKSPSVTSAPNRNDDEQSLGLVEDTAPPVPAARPKPKPTKPSKPTKPTQPAKAPPPPPSVAAVDTSLNAFELADDDDQDLGDIFADLETTGQIASLPTVSSQEPDEQEGGLPSYILWGIIGLVIALVIIWTVVVVLMSGGE
jgi:serine/threonine protein kinase